MALLTNSDALEGVFTPEVGTFRVQVTGGHATLQSRANSGAAWAPVEGLFKQERRCTNEVAGTEYRFVSFKSTVLVRADQ